MRLGVYITYHVPHQLLPILCHLNAIAASSLKFRYSGNRGIGNTLLQNTVSKRVSDMGI
jgi:hypothetical protein